MDTPPAGFAFFAILFSLVILCTILMVVYKVAVWWGGQGVNDYADDGAFIMSPAPPAPPLSTASSLGTDGRTDGRTAQPTTPRAEQLLTLYKLMRAAGISRDDARAALNEAGLPLSNDVWTKAAPPPKVPAPSDDDDVLVTPYAGRRTKASYYPDDPELEYNAP